jgi:arogenate/prephenate dehydratase
VKVAFQGIPGAYSEVAAQTMLGRSVQTIPLDSFNHVFDAVRRGKAARGVIPIENSLAGSIHQNYDLLLQNNLHIVGETHLRIEHALMCHPSSRLRDLTQVRSHPQALAQCSMFFERHRQITPVAFYDTAGAARSVIEEQNLKTGAIASTYAARLYGLRILRVNVEDRRNNFTRFLIVAKKPRQPHRTVRTKCSIVFTPVQNQVGILFRILGVFALRDINLLKIESRPDPTSTFEYMFYLDFSGNPADPNVAKALDHLREMVTDFRLLGAYPEDSRIRAQK